MSEEYSLIKEYDNYYTKKQESICIYYSVYDGWNSVDDTKTWLMSHNVHVDNYRYIQVTNKKTGKIQIYPVNIQTLQNKIVFTKEISYVRNHLLASFCAEAYLPKEIYDSCGIFDFANAFTKPRINGDWKDTILNDLAPQYDITCLTGRPDTITAKDYCILLGTVFFNTYIPVYQLNVMDAYFADEYNSPSRWRLWKKGVRYYNPFRHEAILKNGSKATLAY